LRGCSPEVYQVSEKIKCWEFFDCQEKKCPVYKNKIRQCWLVPGTLCRNEVQKNFLEKIELCLKCEPFKANLDINTIQETLACFGKLYRQSKFQVEERDKELENISIEMAVGLSEVFEALQKISSGDPSVRISEKSNLELIVKLKQLVNQTAENTAEIVDLSHEFAMGLAEHFDVLNRVITGDLSARIAGTSSVELLSYFKEVTNHMIYSVAKEIDERKEAESALRKSESKYRTVLEANPDPVVVYDMQGRVTYLNPSFTDVFGWTLEECVGNKMDRFVPEENWPETKIMIDKVFAGISFYGVETCRLNKDGAIIPVSISGAVYKDDDSNPMGSIITIRNISEHKKMEARLRRAQQMEAIGTLAGGVAHDLNNILSGIVGYPQLLLMDLAPDSHLRKPIETIQKSGDKAAAIVQDLLTLARRGVVTREVVNLNEVINDYLLSPEYEKVKLYHPGIQIETRLEARLLNMLGSPVHLSKTLMNLVSNAAEAMVEEDKIIISTENRYVDRPIKGYDHVKEGDYVVLTVADTGIGISKQDMERVFEPFYTKKVMGRSGTGLGMSVVWGTVKDHEGYIDIDSFEGRGSVITLYFPVSRKKMETDKPSFAIEDYMGHGESILIVDDVAEQREIASDMLTKLGYCVDSVSSGEEAVKYVKQHSVDLLILDMIMDPGMDGLETYQRIVANNPKQRAIIASGFSETVRVKQAQKLGAGVYIKKPYMIEMIGMAVRAELEKQKD
jgi:two-component system cell cycle sensor histidine kinase/response regulator CckA